MSLTARGVPCLLLLAACSPDTSGACTDTDCEVAPRGSTQSTDGEPSTSTGASATSDATSGALETSADTAMPGSSSEAGSTGEPDVSTTGDPGGPQIVSLTQDTEVLGESDSVTFAAIVTDPDGIDDVIGGQLQTPDGDAVYGTFATAANEGSYSLTISRAQILAVDPIAFETTPFGVSFHAVFFDQAGLTATQVVSVDLVCSSEAAICNDSCFPGVCHPDIAPCADGNTCRLNMAGTAFECVEPVDDRGYGEPCEGGIQCASGMCLGAEAFVDCSAQACCTSWCTDAGDCPGVGCQMFNGVDACGEIGLCAQ